MDMKEVGKVEKLPYEIKHFEWRISDFFAFIKAQNYMPMESPTFSFADTSWNLKLYLNWNNPCQFTQLALINTNMKREYLVEYHFGLKNCDGNIEQLLGGILKEDQMQNENLFFVMKSELVRQKSELVPGDVLTITCTVKLMTEMTHSSEQTALDTSRRLIRLEKLSKNLKDLLVDKDTCDTTLKVKEKEYRAHKLILMARSAVFAATFKHDTLERQTGVITISDCDPDSFQLFLDYLYSGQPEELSFPSAINLYYTSDKYDVPELKESCLDYLMHCLTVENVCELAIFADKQDERELFSAVQGFFNQNTFKILSTSDWDDLLMKDPRLANKLLKELSKVKLAE